MYSQSESKPPRAPIYNPLLSVHMSEGNWNITNKWCYAVCTKKYLVHSRDFYIFSKGNFALWVALSRCPYQIPVASFCNKILGDVAQHCTSSYDAVRLVLIEPLNFWRNSTTPFWCKASLFTIKIDNFRTYDIAWAYLTLVVLVSELNI